MLDIGIHVFAPHNGRGPAGCLGAPLGRQVSEETPKEGDVGGLAMGLPYTLMRVRSLEDDETTAFIWGEFQEFLVAISCACCRLLYTGQGCELRCGISIRPELHVCHLLVLEDLRWVRWNKHMSYTLVVKFYDELK